MVSPHCNSLYVESMCPLCPIDSQGTLQCPPTHHRGLKYLNATNTPKQCNATEAESLDAAL